MKRMLGRESCSVSAALRDERDSVKRENVARMFFIDEDFPEPKAFWQEVTLAVIDEISDRKFFPKRMPGLLSSRLGNKVHIC